MMIHVKLLANYREHLPPEAENGGVELDVPDGTTVREEMSRFPIPLADASGMVVNS